MNARPELPEIDPITGEESDIRFLQPYQTRKRYLCPGCEQFIEPGTSHYVVVPIRYPDMRRHWHKKCLVWEFQHGASTR